MNRPRRPAIFQIGRVIENTDKTVTIGWGLGLCMAGCLCHAHPLTGQLAVFEDPVRGRLGLVSFRPDPSACDCCEPWRNWELQQISVDFARLQQIPTAEPTEKEGRA